MFSGPGNASRPESTACQSSRVYAAAPYVTETGELLEAARKGKAVDLLVGLNSSTSPDALKVIDIDEPNIRIRYYTDRFHAKIYLFDDAALVGSSNLTDGGLRSNREATVLLRAPDDAEIIQELRTIFNGLWEPAPVLTQHRLNTFADAYKRHPRPDIDGIIQAAVGKSVPPNISKESQQKNAERIFLESQRKQVAEYRNSFNEVTVILGESHLKRPELAGLDAAMQTDRFLNWVRNGDVLKVKKSLKYLIYGGSEFEERLHDVLYGGLKLRGIGPSSALELYGTLKPQECPPINGATAKALRYLGFNVQAV